MGIEGKLVVRWTIGPASKDGFDCLSRSIRLFQQLYSSADLVVCHNCNKSRLEDIRDLGVELHDQSRYYSSEITPKGVAWKLYPPRIAPDAHELVIDNDVIIEQQLTEIDEFIKGDSTLLLGGSSRNYGRFEHHVRQPYRINSGVYGMPPGFNLEKYINFYVGDGWQKNAHGRYDSSETFDEQGIIALALLDYSRFIIIPETTITNCEYCFNESKGMHFVGLNRNGSHEPYLTYRTKRSKLIL